MDWTFTWKRKYILCRSGNGNEVQYEWSVLLVQKVVLVIYPLSSTLACITY